MFASFLTARHISFYLRLTFYKIFDAETRKQGSKRVRCLTHRISSHLNSTPWLSNIHGFPNKSRLLWYAAETRTRILNRALCCRPLILITREYVTWRICICTFVSQLAVRVAAQIYSALGRLNGFAPNQRHCNFFPCFPPPTLVQSSPSVNATG